MTSMKPVRSSPRKERGYGSAAASVRAAAFAASSIGESFHDLGPQPMSGVHDSIFLLPSGTGNSRLVKPEDAVGAHYRAVRRHIARHHRIRSDGGTAANAHRAEHFGARADEYVILDHRHAAAVHLQWSRVLPAYGDLVHHGHAPADRHAALDDDSKGHRHEDRR